MIVFYASAAVLVLLALVPLLPLLRADGRAEPTDRRDRNIAIARERRRLLDRARDDGELDGEAHAAALEELERSLAADLADSERQATRYDGKGRWPVAIATLILLPVGSFWLYQTLGTPQALDPAFLERVARQQASGGGSSEEELSRLIARLETRLAAEPEDAQGWQLLGRTRLSLGEFRRAAEALRRATALRPGEPTSLVALAEATAMARGGSLVGEPTDLIERALRIAPRHEAGRWLLAISRQQQDRHAEAIEILDTLAEDVGDDPESLANVEQMIRNSRDALAAAAAPVAPEPGPTTPAEDATITVSVRLDPEVAATIPDDRALFVYARAVEGPPMPLAVVRSTAGELPLTVRLDRSQAMLPDMSIDRFDAVTVGARLSTAGNAIAAPGDWFGEVGPVDPGSRPDVEIVIDRQVPG